jgi:hypothetical protein
MRRAIYLLAWVTMLTFMFVNTSKLAGREPTNKLPQRTWRSSTGRYAVAARLLDCREGKVQLRKADGKHIWVSMADLSDADQRYVRSQRQLLSQRPPNPFAVGTAAPEPPVADSAPKGIRRQDQSAERPRAEVMYGVQWYDMEDASQLASADDKPMMWFRVLGDLDGFM